jgi:hypothetical protein
MVCLFRVAIVDEGTDMDLPAFQEDPACVANESLRADDGVVAIQPTSWVAGMTGIKVVSIPVDTGGTGTLGFYGPRE